jgi:K+ transporter
MLILNFFGQAAFLLYIPAGQTVSSLFCAAVPEGYLPVIISIDAIATIIASQALITDISSDFKFILINSSAANYPILGTMNHLLNRIYSMLKPIS